MKTCSRCGAEKPYDDFYKKPDCRDGRQGVCKACQKARAKERWHDGSRRRRTSAEQMAADLKCRNGIDVEQYEALLESQGGGCAICRATPQQLGKRLAVDHDHKCCPGARACGKCVRGLLCTPCNVGITNLGESVQTLMAAAAYLMTNTAILEEI